MLRSQGLGSFRSCAVENCLCPYRFSRPILPLRSDSRQVFLDVGTRCSVDLTPVEEDTNGCAKANQETGNAEYRDRQQPEMIFQKITSDYTSKKSDDH